MTRCSILEYAQAVGGRYLKSPKKMKTKILDEFVVTTGLHRKTVIRLLNRASGSSTPVGAGQLVKSALDAMVKRMMKPTAN